MHYIQTLLLTPDEALSRERVRNEIAREKLSRAKLQRKVEENRHAEAMKELDEALGTKRAGYAAMAAPLLAEFDDISLAQHYYQEVTNTVTSHERVVAQLSEREFGEFGYASKKLISVGMHFEALRHRLSVGAPFADAMRSVLSDADSADLSLLAAPLHRTTSIAPPSALRAAAFDVARAMEEMGKGPAQEPVRGWLDFLKFRTSFSPSMLEMRRMRARRAAEGFLAHIEKMEFHRALTLAEDVQAWADGEKVANRELFDSAFSAFRDVALPSIAADVFCKYAKASLDASRFACVEKMLKEE